MKNNDWLKTNGHYFFNDKERGEPTCVIRFQRGEVKEEHYRENSMYLWDDTFYFTDLEELFNEVIPEFDMFTCGCSINEKQWNLIKNKATKYSRISQDIILEMDEWMIKTIKEFGCVYVIGV